MPSSGFTINALALAPEVYKPQGATGVNFIGTTISIGVLAAYWDKTNSVLRLYFTASNWVTTTSLTTTSNYSIISGPTSPTVTGVTVQSDHIELTLSATPVNGTYTLRMAANTVSTDNGLHNSSQDITWQGPASGGKKQHINPGIN